MANIRDCKGCRHFTKLYTNFDKQGNRVVGGYWCIAKNGRIKTFPKQCNRRVEK